MRLLVARCTVDYSGRLTTSLPEAVRLLMFKADGSFLVHADAGGYKPLNWMTPPTVIEEEPGPEGPLRIVVRKQRAEERLEVSIAEVLCDVEHELDIAAGLEKDGVERDLQLLLAEQPAGLRRGLPPRAPRMADRHRPRRPDVPRRRRRVGRRRDQAQSPRSRPSSS